ncbi:MAG: diaminopimelate epimerase [Opitutaceae bacterium]
MRFHKYHALGNDYIVLDPAEQDGAGLPAPERIRAICHRNFGVGSDGILWGPLPSSRAPFGLRIFNPDGSEAEKSGNGIRIFSRYLRDKGAAAQSAFTIETLGGVVRAELKDGGRLITVDMGAVSFNSAKIPVSGMPREVLNERMRILDREFVFCAATIGNPHCVIPLEEISPELARKYGPVIETHPNFPKRTNVQFMRVMDRNNLRIEIWERGAGYTLASGSSSSAAAAVAHRLELVEPVLTVHMPGGAIGIEVGDGNTIRMTGSVKRVADGTMHPEIFEARVAASEMQG